jgi:hypothetical protein
MGDASSWLPHWQIQMASAGALAGPVAWQLAAGVVAAAACGFAACGVRLVPNQLALRAALLLGAAGGASLWPNAAWYIAMAMAAFWLRSEEPARRLLAVWWLVLSIVTPFYHPYARLWLPVSAVGWLTMSGVIAVLAADASVLEGRKRMVALALVGMGFAAATARWLVAPTPIALTRFLAPHPEASFRAFATDWLPRQPELTGKTFRVWARRPLAFYLAARGSVVFQSEPDQRRLLERVDPHVRAVVDEALLLQAADGQRIREEILGFWRPQSNFPVEADPVTLLDVDPRQAFRSDRRRALELMILEPRMTPERHAP